MNRRLSLLLVLAIGAASLTTLSCSPAEQASTPAQKSATARHDIRGIVVALPETGKMVMVDHEEIPGVMGAMQMELAVPEAADREKMKPGARFEAKLVVENSAMWIEAVTITGQGEVPAAKAHEHMH